jgi:transposase
MLDWVVKRAKIKAQGGKTMSTQLMDKDVEKPTRGGAAKLISRVKRNTRKRFSAEEKIRIVLEGFRKEMPVSELCRKEGISSAIYYSWTKDFMEAGKARLKGDTQRSATSVEVKTLKKENDRLKVLAGEQALSLQWIKKSLNV